MSGKATSTVNGRELTISRLMNAPQELVFEVYTSPEHLTHWWGPDGFTTTTHEMAVKPGGIWRFMMHGPDGRDYPNKIEFLEVVKPERIVYRHRDDGDTEHISFHVTITFEKQGNKTNVIMHSVFSSAEELQRVEAEYHAIEGGRQHLDRFGTYVEKL